MNEVTLRELIESEIRRIEADIKSLARSVDKSEKLLNRRLEGIPSQMATREQLLRIEDRLGVLDNQIRDLREQRAYVYGGAAAVAALISLFGLALRYFLA